MASIIRPPCKEDAPLIHQLAASSPPLDLNSLYAYFLVASHFRQTSAVIESDGRLAGFVAGYRPPENSEALFIWQIGVLQDMRGKGMAMRMAMDIINRQGNETIRYVEATVIPSNSASRAFFQSLARRLDSPLREEIFITSEQMGGDPEKEETMIRIGPMNSNRGQEKYANYRKA